MDEKPGNELIQAFGADPYEGQTKYVVTVFLKSSVAFKTRKKGCNILLHLS